MTDSESDTSNNVFNFQNANATVNANGPNSFSFRNPMTSMYNNMTRNYERPRYAESAYDQRSMYHRRETSPMSMRSIDSCVSAADIAFAFKNGKCNKNDLKMIRDTCQKLLKQRIRKRFEKRRNIRLKIRRRSGDDSGDQASDSSVSSDDYGSVKTYKENIFGSRPERMNLTDFRKTITDCNIPKNSLNILSLNTFKNKFSIGSSTVNNTQNLNSTTISNQFNFMPTQKDRFRNGFLLPSQRFNRSIASSAILENAEKPHKNSENLERNCYAQNNHNKNKCPSGSEEEEIFSEMIGRHKSTLYIDSQRKRNLDSDDESSLPDSKRSRTRSPAKNAPYNKRAPPQLKNINPSNNDIELINDFEFAKPALPIRKSKPKTHEKLIAKSAQPLTDFLEPIHNKLQENLKKLQPSLQENSNDNLSQLDQSETTQNGDVSSRPSFIKRKLFTQNLDVAEKTNLNTDAINSPQSSAYSLQKEKNKSRKLVSNQSCLNRDVEDHNNLLDLIHKIVPPDRMNLTNQTTINQNKSDINNKNKKDDSKWDVTSVISICNEDDISDTFTDEEIFKADNTAKLTDKNKDINSKAKPIDKLVAKSVMTQDDSVMFKKLENNSTMQNQVVDQNFKLTHNNVTQTNAKNLAKTFWDTDFESDADCETILPRIHVTDILKKANSTLDTSKQNFKNPVNFTRIEISETCPDSKHLNSSLMNNTVNTFNNMHKLNTSTLSVRSHRTARKKKCCNEICGSEKSKVDNTVNKMTDNYEVLAENNVVMINSKTKALQNKKPTDIPKSKLNNLNEKNSTVARSTSQSKTSPKKTKLAADKQTISPKNQPKKSESKSKSEKSNNVNIKKSKPAQNNKTAVNKAKKPNEDAQDKNNQNSITQNDKKETKKLNTPKIKHKSHTDSQNDSMRTKKNKPVPQPTHLNINNTVQPKQNTSFTSGRPIRSCRTPNQSRSIELSRSAHLNNTSVGINRSLRSRVINLSPSIENITIKIKSKRNNKTISQMKTRESDISFSIGSKENTPVSKKKPPVSKKKTARSRADFFKG